MTHLTSEGERRKREELKRMAERRAVYVRIGQRALLELLLQHGTATADDVYPSVDLPPDIDPRCLAAIYQSLANAGIIQSTGYTKSKRPERHSSPINQWELIDAVAAKTWLDAHPELQDEPANGAHPELQDEPANGRLF